MIRSNRRNRRTAPAPVLVLALLLGICGAAQSRPRALAESEARMIVMEALDPSARNLRGLRLDFYTNTNAPDFYQCDVTWEPTTDVSPVVGSFSVNRATGDVWNPVLCRRIESPGLRRLQKALRKGIGLGDEELRRLTDKPPWPCPGIPMPK